MQLMSRRHLAYDVCQHHLLTSAVRLNLVDYYGASKHRSLAAAQHFYRVLSRGREGAVLCALLVDNLHSA